jgi:hypothetical protein
MVVPSFPLASTEEQARMELVARINQKKQAKVPLLDISKNVLYAQRKDRVSSRISSSSVSRVGSAEPI